MTYHVDTPRRVKRELHKITDWYRAESGSEKVAQKWFHGILAALDTLRENPLQYGLAHESDDFPFELRQLLYGSGKRITHRALFRIDGDVVQVLTVRHVSQDDITPDDVDV